MTSNILASTRERSSYAPRRHRADMLMLLFIAILLLLGLIVIYAISPALTARINGGQNLDENTFMYRQLLYLAIGIAAFAVTSFVPVSFWQKMQGRLLVGGMVLCTLPFLLQATPFGLCANGACRWIDISFISFQPAEFLKFALVIFLAGFLSVRAAQGAINDLQKTLVPVGILLLAVAVLVIGLQKDLGTGITIFCIVMAMLFMAGVSRKLLGLIIGGSLLLGFIFTVATPGRWERVLTFVGHQSAQQNQTDYHINQALIAVGSGGLTGKGLGQSIQAFGYLPEAANDSIFAILAEKFGFLGTVAVLAIFTALFMRILTIFDHTADPYSRLIVGGVFGWVFSHTVINVGAMLGIFPLTGITLPFVSFGGTSLLFVLAALGLVFRISRYTSFQKQTDNQIGGSNDHRERGWGVRRSRHSGVSRVA